MKPLKTFKNNSVATIIVAAGSSRRMAGVDKLLLKIGNCPVILYSVAAFEEIERVSEIVIVASKNNFEEIKSLISARESKKPLTVVLGGETRAQSVINGINALESDCQYVAVHDGARPLVHKDDIEGVFSLAEKTGAAILAAKVKDTVKVVKNNLIIDTPDRKFLYNAQTPQVFKLSAYRKLILANPHIDNITDDASLFEANGFEVSIFEGRADNIKITEKHDLYYIEGKLKV